MFGGTSSIQTNKGKEKQAVRAKAWATLLPWLLVWESEKVPKELAIDLKSFTKWPTRECVTSLCDKAFITPSASPSKLICCKPSSIANTVALLAANNSRVSTDDGRAIFSDSAAITSPNSFWITTPIPVSPSLANTAPSKFAFNSPVARGFHLAGDCFSFGPRPGNFYWNSVSITIAESKTLLTGTVCSLHLILFLRHQTDQATVANTSSRAEADCTMPTKSDIVFSWLFWFWSQVKLGCQADWIVSQPYTAWKVSSEAFWHRLQTELSTTLLFCRFTFVGKAFVHAHQRKILTLFGTLSCQIFLQKLLDFSSDEAEASSALSNSHNTW